MVWAGIPSSVTLVGLKLHCVPVGRPAVQPPGEPKFTVPVNPVVGVMVIVCVAVCPAGTVRLVGLADMEYGAITVTTAGETEVETLLYPSPLYVAVTLSVPAGSVVVVNIAVPPERALVAKAVAEPLLKKLTVPVAVDGVTLAVKVTLVP